MGKRVLIAEDNKATRDLYIAILDQGGFECVGFEDGGTALDAIKEQNFDAAVVDQMMEPKGGFEFALGCLTEQIKLPIIMVTAHDVADLLVQASKHGITQVLKKPVKPEHLVRAVSKATA